MGIRDKINAHKAEQEQQTQANRQAPPRPALDPFSASHNGEGPFSKLADLATWADILEPANWKSVDPGAAATKEAWRHPNATQPISAKVLKVNPHCLVVWSTNSGLPDGADQNLTKGRVYAHLWHGGNESAAATAMLKGEATHLAPHLQEAVKGTRNGGAWQFEGLTPRPKDGPSANGSTGNGAQDGETEDKPPHQKKGRFTVRTFTDIQPRTSTWLLDGVLPDDDLTVFIGEEGIAKVCSPPT
jgi:hypothetical protein